MLELLLFALFIIILFFLPAFFDGGDPTTPLARARLRVARERSSAARDRFVTRLLGRPPPPPPPL